MGRIKLSNHTELHFNDKHQLHYKGSKVGKWWGKTLYRIDQDNNLHYKTFSIIGRLLHFFGYQKHYRERNLNNWQANNNFKIQDSITPNQRIEQTVQQTLGNPPALREYEHLNSTNRISNRVQTASKTLSRKQTNELAGKLLRLLEGWMTPEQELEAINIFKNSGLSVNTVLRESGETPLLLAAKYKGRLTLATFLIENGANVNARTNERSGLVHGTPLQRAVSEGDKELVLLLLENNADVNLTSSDGTPTLHMALYPFSYSNRNRDDAIIVLQELFKRKPDVNITNKRGDSLLYKACELDDLDLIKLLVEAGADVNAFGKFGKPPLFAAIAKGNPEIVNFLIGKGADCKPVEPEYDDPYNPGQKCSKSWETPIHLACRSTHRKRIEMIRLLHQNGADVNAEQPFSRETPLHFASQKDDLEVVNLLLEFGADRSKVNREQKKAIDIARDKKLTEIAEALSA